jgi:hypothetical protein
MVHVHGRDVAQRAAGSVGSRPSGGLLVPVDVGKHEAMALVADATGERLVAPFTFTLDRPGLAEFVQRVERVAPPAVMSRSRSGSRRPGTTTGR